MAAFGATSATSQGNANWLVYDGAVDAAYTPNAGLAGEFGILAGVVAGFLIDRVPFPAGTSAAPGVAFGGDSDTGFFQVGANEIGVVASGANVGGWTTSGFKIGHTSSTVLTKFVVYSVSLVPTARTDAAGAIEATFAVTGVTTADKLIVNPPAVSNNNVATSWRTTAADTVQAIFVQTAASKTATSGTYTFVAIRS